MNLKQLISVKSSNNELNRYSYNGKDKLHETTGAGSRNRRSWPDLNGDVRHDNHSEEIGRIFTLFRPLLIGQHYYCYISQYFFCVSVIVEPSNIAVICLKYNEM